MANETIVVHGFIVSPHVRTARMAFHEKGVEVEFRNVGLDQVGGEDYSRINPFQKMPALTQGDLVLYETPALMVYADGVGAGPSLEPSNPAARATMWKFIGIAQHYLYRRGVMELYFHRVLAPLFGMEANAATAEAAIPFVGVQLDVIEAGLTREWLAGSSLSHADLYCGAMVDYLARSRDGRMLVEARPRTRAWLESLRARESFQATFPPMLAGSDQA